MWRCEKRFAGGRIGSLRGFNRDVRRGRFVRCAHAGWGGVTNVRSMSLSAKRQVQYNLISTLVSNTIVSPNCAFTFRMCGRL